MTEAGTLRPGRVLLGFDGSGPALRALDHAVDEARRRGTGLAVLCGRPWVRQPAVETAMGSGDGRTVCDVAREMLDAAVSRARRRADGLSVTPVLTAQPAEAALLNYGRTASLIVLGPRGHGGFARPPLGSVTLRVVTHSPVPVLIVRGDQRPPRGCVLVGLASDADTAALRFGFEEAVRRGADLRVLHAWKYPPATHARAPRDRWWDDLEMLAKSAEAVPRFAVAPLRDEFPGVAVRTEAVCLSAGHALTEASREAEAVVLASHRHGTRFDLRPGPVTHVLLRHARCPVTVVPTD
ncbi:universal stress protein [Streptomyces sp. NPDC020379]|uniref:universal stress protein n=1 Tax=Streptomyces sp. NPDC020379 TaxID=3365071 RepID=UPI003791E3C5